MKIPPLAIAASLLVLAGTAHATVTPAQLQQFLKEGRAIKLIDVRPTHRYKLGSIPGAINIPAAIVTEKTLPPIGQVILFSDGLAEVDERVLVAAMNAKAGITADYLAGGYAAWLEFSNETTAPSGLRPGVTRMVAYQSLEKMGEHVILVDLRKPRPAPAPAGPGAEPEKTAPEPDVLVEFCKAPNREYCRDLGELRRAYRRVPAGPNGRTGVSKAQPLTPVVVLIDNDEETALAESRKLKAEGYHRVMVLAGGEFALQVKGQPGLGRVTGTKQMGSEPK